MIKTKPSHSDHRIHGPGTILRLLIIILFIFTGGVVEADHRVTADHTGFSRQSEKIWSAKWIWQENSGPANTWMCLRKQVHFDEIPQRAEACIAADSKYWLWVNGRLVVFEGGLNRGPTPRDGYFDRIDMSPYLKKGTNTFAVLVWYWGKSGRNSVDSGAGGLVLEIDTDKQKVISDSTWKLKPHPAHYGPLEGEQPSGILPEQILASMLVKTCSDGPLLTLTTAHGKTPPRRALLRPHHGTHYGSDQYHFGKTRD